MRSCGLEKCFNHKFSTVCLSPSPAGMIAVYAGDEGEKVITEPVIALAVTRERCNTKEEDIGEELQPIMQDGPGLIHEDGPSNLLGWKIPGDGRDDAFWEQRATDHREGEKLRKKASRDKAPEK